jgi:peptidoglycan hydrolase-like protein with peptidoglycan-binding domain
MKTFLTIAAIVALAFTACSPRQETTTDTRYSTSTSDVVGSRNISDNRNLSNVNVPSETVDTNLQDNPASGAILNSADTMNTTSSTRIRAAQRALTQQGHSLTVSGIMDASTTQAIRKFQVDENLTETGTLNQETLDALQINEGRQPASVLKRTKPSTTPTR